MSADESERLRDEGRRLRDVSNAILAALKDLRELERDARGLRIGSREHTRISQEITDRAQRVFRLTAQQETLATVSVEQDLTIDDVGDDQG